MIRKLSALLAALLILTTNGFAQPSHTWLLYSDMLDNGASTALGLMVNNGGAFLPGKGWQAIDENSQLKITLPEGLPFEGTFAIDVTNFDPVSQNMPDGVKQHILNMYSQENGNKDIFETDGSWWNIRTGTGYSAGEGMAGFKFLAAPRGIDSRDEERCMESSTWSTKRVYEFRVIWTTSKIYCLMDGVVQCELPFSGQVEPFRYIFVGKDNLVWGYSGQPGPIYSNLRIYVKDQPAQASFTFTDITASSQTSGYSTSGYGRGVSFADVDGDGKLDLFVSNAANNASIPDLLYFNQGNNQFQEQAADGGVSDAGLTHSIVSADIDNDGDLDAFFANMPAGDGSSSGRNALYRNDGKGYFTDITDSSDIGAENNSSRGAVAADFDKDGDLDLFAVNWGQANEMYFNDGTGKMTRVHRGADGNAENPDEFIRQGVTAADFDNDHDVDIYVCRRREGSQPAPNWLFVNDGSGLFTEEAGERGVALDGKSNGASFADVDRDGDFDLFVIQTAANADSLPKLAAFFNRGDGTFEDRTNEFDISVSGYSLVFGDVDNDADPDLYLIRNDDMDPAARPRLYLNDGTGHFDKVSCPGLEAPAQDARGAAYGDIDNDGDIDFYLACSKGANFLLRNDLDASNHYLEVLCLGPKGDYGGFGSKVSLYQAGHLGDPAYLLGYQEAVSNFGYMSQNQTALHFGLGGHDVCDVQVVLTNGEVVEYRNQPADQTIVMKKKPALAIRRVSGDSQTGYVERTLAQPFVVRVTDSDSVAQSGIAVSFVVTQGDGRMLESQPVQTGADGLAASHLVFGPQAGLCLVEARCENAIGSPVLFQAEATVPPVLLTVLGGDNQTGRVGEALADSIVVQAGNPDGRLVANYPVVFQVHEGSGSLDGDSSKTIWTSSIGQAAVKWTLGRQVGMHRLQAFSSDTSIEFSAKAIAGDPAALQAISGAEQQLAPGQSFPQPFVVKVTDVFANPVAGQPVQFEVISGGGCIGDQMTTVVASNDSGKASVVWTPGPYRGPENTLQASSRFNGAHLQGSPCVWRFPGVAVDAEKSRLTAIGIVKEDGQRQVEVLATLRDQLDTPAAGLTVKFILTGIDASAPIPEVVADNNGQATGVFVGLTADTVVAKAMVLGLNLMLADSAVVIFQQEPPVADSLILVSGNNQTGVVAAALPEPFVVRVLDQKKQPMPDCPVQFRVLSGGGHFDGLPQLVILTDSTGLAQSTLTLGTVAGRSNNRVQVTVDSSANSPLVFIASATPGEASKVEKASGDNQVGRIGNYLAEPLVVKISDQFGNGVPSVFVYFEAIDQGFIETPQPIRTDSTGRAECLVRLGNREGEYHFTAKLENGVTILFTAIGEDSCCPPRLVSLSPDSQTVYSGMVHTFALSVKAEDSNGNPVEGILVLFTLEHGAFSFTPDTVLTDSQGIATCQVTANFDPGAYIFQARYDSSIVTFTIMVLAAPDHAPEIVAWRPPNNMPLSVHYGELLTFQVAAVDADNDTLFFFWRIDETIVDTDSVLSVIVNPSLPPDFTVAAFVHDGKDTTSVQWRVHVQPSLIELSAFTANMGRQGTVSLAWEAKSEADLLGFHVLRSQAETGPYKRINPGLISSNASNGGRYTFEDWDILAGERYFYKLEEVSRSGQTALHGPVSIVVELPRQIVLHQNYPNPFNPTTCIGFELPEKMYALVRIYNLSGQLIATLAEGELNAGHHTVVWNGMNELGQPMPSGVYYYRLESKDFSQMRKLVFMK